MTTTPWSRLHRSTSPSDVQKRTCTVRAAKNRTRSVQRPLSRCTHAHHSADSSPSRGLFYSSVTATVRTLTKVGSGPSLVARGAVDCSDCPDRTRSLRPRRRCSSRTARPAVITGRRAAGGASRPGSPARQRASLLLLDGRPGAVALISISASRAAAVSAVVAAADAVAANVGATAVEVSKWV